VETFKDLTAVETKVTEIIDKDGKIDKRRVVVSDFLVYESQIKPGAVLEYRITRTVDGKLVGKDGKQAIELFEKLAKAKTLEQEGRRLTEENLKYTLNYYRWGVTLDPVPQFQNSAVAFELAGRERIGDRDTIVLKYRRKDFRAGEFRGLARNFKDPRTGNRGRVWLDPLDFRIWRWENESTITDRDITTEAVLGRDEVEYIPSTFSPNVPTRIVTSFFDKAKGNTIRLAGRITFTYPEFKRFNVATEYRIEAR
jgi:hypothetical protein